jgi:hypothetical protein
MSARAASPLIAGFLQNNDWHIKYERIRAQIFMEPALDWFPPSRRYGRTSFMRPRSGGSDVCLSVRAHWGCSRRDSERPFGSKNAQR